MSTREIYIDLSGGYGFDRLERMIRSLQPLLQITEPANVVLDMRRLVHVGPTALALLTAAAKRVVEDDLLLDGSFVPPNSPPVRRYLERMNLMRELTGGETHEDFTRRNPEGFRPCERFSTGENYVAVARSLTEAISERCQVDDVSRQAIRVCLDEICENVVHHADTELGGFAAAQGWPNSKARQFEVGIVDLGVGVRASLAKNPRYAAIPDDAVAISTALQPRVSSTPERNAGIGLFVTTLLLAFNGGQLVVRSGTGAVTRGGVVREARCDAVLPGTVVAIRANMDRPLDLTPVYEALDRAVEALQASHRHDDHPGHEG